jgi:hypothetical protein
MDWSTIIVEMPDPPPSDIKVGSFGSGAMLAHFVEDHRQRRLATTVGAVRRAFAGAFGHVLDERCHERSECFLNRR